MRISYIPFFDVISTTLADVILVCWFVWVHVCVLGLSFTTTKRTVCLSTLVAISGIVSKHIRGSWLFCRIEKDLLVRIFIMSRFFGYHEQRLPKKPVYNRLPLQTSGRLEILGLHPPAH